MPLGAVPGRPPVIRFASNGTVRLAFQSFGDGSHDIVFVPPMETNLGATWDEPVYAAFLRRLAGLGRVTIFDKRGSGLSDPVLEWPSEQERSEDVRAVLEAAGVDRAVLLGVCDGGVRCVRFAARYPDKVAGLVLIGVPARLLRSHDFEWGWPEKFYLGADTERGHYRKGVPTGRWVAKRIAGDPGRSDLGGGGQCKSTPGPRRARAAPPRALGGSVHR